MTAQIKTHHVVCLSQWTAELNAAITQKFFAWLVGPLEVQEAEVEYKGQKQTWKSGVQIKKCRYLEQSGCKGMCINMCKVGHLPCHMLGWQVFELCTDAMLC